MKTLMALVACLVLSGCTTLAAVQIRPPAEAAALCRALVEPANDSVDAMIVGYAAAIDAYRDCALRHRALVEWAQ